MNFKTAFLILMVAIAFSIAHAENFGPDDYSFTFAQDSTDPTQSVLIICNLKTNICTKEFYKNKDLSKKTYDKEKGSKALKRVDDASGQDNF